MRDSSFCVLVSLDTGLVSFNDQFRQDMLGIGIANCLQPAWLAKSQGLAGLTRRATQVSSLSLKSELKIAFPHSHNKLVE